MSSMGNRRTWMTMGFVAAAAGGCKTTPPPATAAAAPIRSDVTDIRPMPRSVVEAAPPYDPPQYDTSGPIPVASQPLTEPAPVVATAKLMPTPVLFTETAAPVAKSPPAHGRTHVVRRGETWFAIARSTYGDGAQWHRLAAANPSAAAAGPLKVGQKLVLP